jgi:hypothetical protein
VPRVNAKSRLLDLRRYRHGGLRFVYPEKESSMKKTIDMISAALLAVGFALSAGGQTPGPAQPLASSKVIDEWVTKWQKQLVDVAEAMPADKYPFVPTVGEFKGVRTFGEQVKHVAAANYILAAGALGEKPPSDAGDEMGPGAIRTKPEIVAYLQGSFAALHKAAGAIDDQNKLVATVPPISPLQGRGTRLGLVVEAIFHSANHYGQMVEYLRMNGVVPPGSR